jgi:DNA replication protein DnaC
MSNSRRARLNTELAESRARERAQRSAERDRREDRLFESLPRLAAIQQEKARIALDLSRLAAGLEPRSGLDRDGLNESVARLEAEWQAIFTQQQIPPDYLEVWWNCPSCRDSGWLRPDEKCRCLVQEEINHLYHQSELPPELQEQTFETFRIDLYPTDVRSFMEQVLAECKAFAARVASGQTTENLVFRGAVGLGKTHLSSAIAHIVLRSGRSVIYLTLPDLLDRIRYYKFEALDPDALSLLREVDLLILDDLGGEKVSEFSVQELFSLFNYRITHRLPMVVSTNLSWTDLEGAYTARIASRLMGSSLVLKLDGDDIRLLRKRSRS